MTEKTEQSLKNRTIKGTFWSAADALLGQGVSFLIGIVLARILSPSEYGLIGIVLIFTTVFYGIVDSGFSNALIRKIDVTNDDYNTMFFTNLCISILSYILLFFSSPYIAAFFERPELIALIRVMTLVLIIQALSMTQMTMLSKKVDFKTKTKASLISAVTSGVLGITMAYKGYGVWALVGQQLSRQTIYTICLWALLKWWPSLTFNLHSFRYMWGFGWKMMLSGILSNTWSQLYSVVIGKFYTPITLGQYTRATEYASLLSSNFTAIIQRVSFPVLAEIQNDEERMVIGYRRIIKTSMFVTSVCMIFMGATSEPFIYTLIGSKWHEAATYLPYICISMSLYPLHAINLNMLQVLGRSDIYLFLDIIKKIIGIIPLFLGVFISIYWMLISSVIIGIICFFLNSYYSGVRLHYSSWTQIKDVSSGYGVAFAVAISVYFLKYLPFSSFVVFVMQFCVGAVVAILVSEIFRVDGYIEVKRIAQQGVSKLLKIEK